MSEIAVVIMAGGQGSRFWPISRAANPKQFLSISSSGESLIQATARRLEPLTEKQNLRVITNVLHQELVKTHIPYANIIAEPCARNTAAAVGLAAIHVAKTDPKAVMIVLPADHIVENEAQLIQVYQEAITLAENEDVLVTLGIKPGFANTAYGYIHRGQAISGNAFRVAGFYEKPSLGKAEEYFQSGDYFWNSGMFIWRADVILAAIEAHMPKLSAGLKTIYDALDTKAEDQVVEEVFNSLESTSIDFGVLEHAENCAVITAEDFGWNDVGSWDAWAEHFDTDENGNVLHGDTLVIDTKSTVVHSEKRLTAVLGLEDMIVIDSENALMVCPRSRVQEVKKFVEELKQQQRKDLI